MTLRDLKSSVIGFNENAEVKIYSPEQCGLINVNAVSYRAMIDPKTNEIIHEVIIE